MTKSANSASRTRPIDKALFASGLQSAKRLYLDYHQADQAPDLTPNREHLAQTGQELLELARGAFPKGLQIEGKSRDAKVKRTAEAMQEKKPQVLFGPVFRHDDLEADSDIVLTSSTGSIDLYEVKAGARVKTRHVMDLAFQVHVIESCGHKVRTANVLHLNARYEHRPENTKGDYPVQQLFKSVDLTAKVRRYLPKVAAQLKSMRQLLEDPSTLDLPTGTFCKIPYECPYLARCLAEGPKDPLVLLPDLTAEQEAALHEDGIETLSQVDRKRPGLTLVQRRALHAIEEKDWVLEPFVPVELQALPMPLHFVDIQQALLVMPVFSGTRPWQQIPFQWTVTTLREVGLESKTFQADGKEDPRILFLKSLASAVGGEGTIVVYGTDLEERLREFMEDLPDNKADTRVLLKQPTFDMQRLIRVGTYHPAFGGSFELDDVRRSIQTIGKGDIQSVEGASLAFLRLMNARTKAPTRTKLKQTLADYGTARSEALLELYRLLVRRT